ncbi:MAG: hypothetical protein QF535_21490, partial [Anaerolineales bacterium]|nr:hypothetical protein [Anaerolineales bacterium]
MSFWIFDSHLLGSLLNAFMVIAYPVLFGVVAYTFDKRRHTILLAVFFGILLSLYSAFQAGAWQVEWYGAFFGSLYAVALIFFQKKRSSSASIAIFTVCILLSIGFKEPFIFSLIGVGLLLLPKKKDLLSGLVMPLGIAAVAGVIGLLILGYAQGYFSLYLPSQFGHQAARAVPLWQRGMSIHVLMKYIWEFSYIFSVLITALFAHAVFQSRKFAYPGLRTAVVVLALYLGLTAGNLRGYPVGNHFVVMVPLYTAL